MIDFETWWNSSSADEFRRLNDDMDGRVVRPVWDAAIRATLSSQKATSAAPSPEATQPTQAEAPSDEAVAVEFYRLNPSAALLDFRNRVATQQAEAPSEREAFEAKWASVYPSIPAPTDGPYLVWQWGWQARAALATQQAGQAEPVTQLDGIVSSAMRGYLRRCSSGGMRGKDIELVQVNVDEAERLGYFKLAIAQAILADREQQNATAATPPAPGQVLRVLRSDMAGGPVQRYRLYEGGYMEPYIGGDWVTYADVCATFSDPGQVERDREDALREFFALHAAELEGNAYAYCELAYTRSTGWMAWITDKPLAYVVESPDRKVIAQGQGATPQEAARAAIRAARSSEGGDALARGEKA